MSRQITPGILDVGSADALTRAIMEVERLKAKTQLLEQQLAQISPDIQLFNRDRFPAKVTTVDTVSGGCAWTRQTFTTLGQRTDDTRVRGYTNYNAAYPVGTTISASNLPVEVEMRKRIVTQRGSLAAADKGATYEFDWPSGTGGTSVGKTFVLQIQSGSANSFGYPARLQTWNSAAGTWGDASATEVRVENPNGGIYTVGDYVEASYLGVNSSAVDCYVATPNLEFLSTTAFAGTLALPLSTVGNLITTTITAGVWLLSATINCWINAFTAPWPFSKIQFNVSSSVGTLNGPTINGAVAAYNENTYMGMFQRAYHTVGMNWTLSTTASSTFSVDFQTENTAYWGVDTFSVLAARVR